MSEQFRQLKRRFRDWLVRLGATPKPWLVITIGLALVDSLSPYRWQWCVLHLAVLLLAFQVLPRRQVPALIILMMAAVAIPVLLHWPVEFEPARLWVQVGLLCAVLFHSEQQRRRKRRLAIRQQLQQRVRRRTMQVRQINEALRREIATRQQTQQRLNRAETHLESLAKRMQLQVIRKDINGVITYANQAFCQGVGRPTDAVIGCTDADLYPPQLADAYRLDDQRVIRSGHAVDHIESHPLADGKTGWVQVFKAPEYDDQKQVIGIQMIFWDVTDSYRKTAELRRSEARKRALFDAAHEAVLLVDENGIVVEANPAAEAMLTLPDEQLKGRLLNDVAVPLASLSGGVDEFGVGNAALATESAGTPPLQRRAHPDPENRPPLRWGDLPRGQRREIVLQRFGDDRLPAEVSVHPIPIEDSLGMAIFIRDVTLRHRAVAALRQAKTAAEQASRIKSEFMASVSHEIRTPLGGITGSAELLAQMDLPPKARQYVEMIRNSGELLASVIGDILDLASIEAGRLHISPEPTDLHRCVGEAFRSLATRAMGKDVELVLDIRPVVPRLGLVDPKRLRQIVINLAGNAIKFTPSGHVILCVDLTEAPPADDEDAGGASRLLSLEMIDSGIGIATDHLEKIFEPFEQGDSGTTRRFGGTGLGLSITRQLVRRMGGSVDVVSQLGQGSTFRCLIPWIPVEQAVADQRSKEPGEPVLGSVAVEIPHPIQRRAISELLQCHGYRIDPQAPVRIVDRGLARSHGSYADGESPADDQLTIWLSRVDDLSTADFEQAAAVLIKPVLPDDLLDLLQAPPESLRSGRPRSDETVTTGASRQRAEVADPQGDWPAAARLLLVDDSPVNQAVIREFLSGAGYQVQVATSGEQATAAAEKDCYDLVLMDLQMPGMDGIEAMQRMVDIYSRRQQTVPPFVALTAHATEEHRQRCLRTGMVAFLVKPIDRLDLLRCVASLVQPDWQSSLLRAAGGSQETATALVDAFLVEVPQLCESLQHAFEAGDVAVTRRAAHTLKSCLKYVAPSQHWELAQRVEEAAARSDMRQVGQCLPAALDVAHGWIQRLRQNSPN